MNGVIGFTYNGNAYYYEKNIQGDVTAIVDANGTIKAKYIYDAWGNQTITLDIDGIGTLNPFRYRSYYFDTETGLYYLNSRYYDPVTCRFINADSIIDAVGILGYNMFAYCNNNPIIRKDPSGKTFLYDPDEPDWASSYNQDQLDMIHRIGIDEFASYDSWVQDAMLYSALMGEPYTTELYTTQVEDPLTVYKDNFVASAVGETLENEYKDVFPAYNAASTTNSFISDIQSDRVVYNRNPVDLCKAVAITTIAALLDFGAGKLLSKIPGIAPVAVPVTSLSSTVIYYIKQGAKLAWIGY